mmetsp:Transcript_79911/g.139427  ORF Transcript_79911/g.139427 Transcript_79911/m.139427 type:complete len:98 (-) Transcript_79911:208-501(-)
MAISLRRQIQLHKLGGRDTLICLNFPALVIQLKAPGIHFNPLPRSGANKICIVIQVIFCVVIFRTLSVLAIANQDAAEAQLTQHVSITSARLLQNLL